MDNTWYNKILNKRKDIILVLDIGTNIINALIFKKEKGRIVILDASSERFDLSASPGQVGQDFKRDIIKKAILEVVKPFKKRLQDNHKISFVSLPANILKGRLSSQVLKRKEPKKTIEQIEEKKILEEISEKTKKEILESLSKETGILAKDFHFLNLRILEIKIDGYQVPQLLGYKGSELNFKIFITFVLKYHFDNFRKTWKELNLKSLNLIHQAQGIISLLGKEYPNSLFLNIGDSLTQIFLIKDSKLEMVQEFEVGEEDFCQSLSQTLGISQKRAYFLKERYSKGVLSEKVYQRIKKIFYLPGKKWFSNLELKLSSQDSLLPSLVLLSGNVSIMPDIEEIIEKRYKELALVSSPEIKFIFPKDFQKIKDRTNKLTNPKDVPILLTCFGLKE